MAVAFSFDLRRYQSANGRSTGLRVAWRLSIDFLDRFNYVPVCSNNSASVNAEASPENIREYWFRQRNSRDEGYDARPHRFEGFWQ